MGAAASTARQESRCVLLCNGSILCMGQAASTARQESRLVLLPLICQNRPDGGCQVVEADEIYDPRYVQVQKTAPTPNGLGPELMRGVSGLGPVEAWCERPRAGALRPLSSGRSEPLPTPRSELRNLPVVSGSLNPHFYPFTAGVVGARVPPIPGVTLRFRHALMAD